MTGVIRGHFLETVGEKARTFEEISGRIESARRETPHRTPDFGLTVPGTPLASGMGMLRTPYIAALLLSLTAVSACTPLPRVALVATPADLEVLAGDWVGEYESAALARRGSLEFKLKAGTDQASGAVLMIPRGRTQPYQAEPHGEAVPRGGDPFRTEFLTIRFIRAVNGSITGQLDRYWDPDRECYATTVFHGFTGDGVVEGTFRTIFERGAGDATGNWRAVRRVTRR